MTLENFYDSPLRRDVGLAPAGITIEMIREELLKFLHFESMERVYHNMKQRRYNAVVVGNF